MKKLIILIILNIQANIIFGQIYNESIENLSCSYNCNTPAYNYFFNSCVNNWICGNNNPNLYKSSCNTLNGISAPNGEYFAGLSIYEWLVYQLPEGEKLKSGNDYIISFDGYVYESNPRIFIYGCNNMVNYNQYWPGENAEKIVQEIKYGEELHDAVWKRYTYCFHVNEEDFNQILFYVDFSPGYLRDDESAFLFDNLQIMCKRDYKLSIQEKSYNFSECTKQYKFEVSVLENSQNSDCWVDLNNLSYLVKLYDSNHHLQYSFNNTGNYFNLNFDIIDESNYTVEIEGLECNEYNFPHLDFSTENDFLPTYISDNQVWNEEKIITNNVYILNNAQLTINANVYSLGGAIIVEKGGKLIIDNGALLTSQCTDQWSGIIVKGNPTINHFNFHEHGIVEIKNGVIIENAIRGVGNSYSDQDNGGIVECENTTFRNCIFGIHLGDYKFSNNSFAKNCTFTECKYGIHLDGIREISFEGNEFVDSDYGIFAFDSKYSVLFGNVFSNLSEAGISSYARAPGLSSLVVLGGNQFINCNNYGITQSGSTANDRHEISGNYFENCWFSVDIDGDNYYLVKDNNFNSCAYGVLSWASGENKNDVKCNEMLNTIYGNIYMLYRNSQSSFLGNNFLESESGPYKFDFRAYNATIAMKQGDEDHPAMNYFWSTDDIETDNSDHFDYYKPNPPVPRTDPQNPGNYTEKNSTTDDQQDCGAQPVPYITDVYIRTVKLEYCRIWQLYRSNPNSPVYKKMFYEISRQFCSAYYYWSIQNEQNLTWQQIVELLRTICGQKWLTRLYGLYLHHGDIPNAEAVLNELADPWLYEPPIVPDDLSDESRASFIAVQRINLRYLKSNGTYQFTNSDIDILRTESVRNIPERAYARSLYTFATGELLPTVLPEEAIQPRESEEILSDKEWSLGPNPASDELTINYNGKGKISGIIKIFGTDGRMVKNMPAIFYGKSNAELKVSSLESGIYMISLTDENNTVIFKDKFIKIK